MNEIVTVEFGKLIDQHVTRKVEPGINSICYEKLPLLIRDVHKVQFEGGQYKSVFGVRFRTCVIYGESVSGECKCKNDKMTHYVDDGTGQIAIHYMPKQRCTEFSAVNRLRRQIIDAKKHGFPQFGLSYSDPFGEECKDLVDCMSILLGKHKARFSRHRYKMFVVGNPYVAKSGDVEIWAEGVSIDSADDRTKEIFFKRHLMKIYKSVYIGNI